MTTLDNLWSDYELEEEGNAYDSYVMKDSINYDESYDFEMEQEADVMLEFEAINFAENELPYGGYFKYTHKFDDKNLISILKRYGIFRTVKAENYNNNCLFEALEYGGYPEEKLEDLRVQMKTRDIPKKRLKEIADKLGFCIKLTEINKGTTYHGDEKKPIYEVGLYDNHYFVYEKTKITRYFLKNYEEVKEEKKPHTISDSRGFSKKTEKKLYERRECATVSSLTLFKLLMENKHLEEIVYDKQIMATQFYKKQRNVRAPISDITSKETKFEKTPKIDLEEQAKNPPEVPESKYDMYAADFEAMKEAGKKDEPILADGRHLESDINKTFFGKKCAYKLLKWICERHETIGPYIDPNNKEKGKKPLKIIFHNLDYDLRFLFGAFTVTSILPKGNLLYEGKGFYNTFGNMKTEIHFKCTLRLIPKPLSEWGEMFKLKKDNGEELSKEVMPYRLYTKRNVDKVWCPIEEAIQILKEDGKKYEDLRHFSQMLKKLRWTKRLSTDGKQDFEVTESDDTEAEPILREDGTFNIIAYCAYYCAQDTRVTSKGYQKFREWVYKATSVDVDDCITTTSIAKKLMAGCRDFEGVHKLGGSTRDFIDKCKVGGRTMLANNKKVHAKGKIADFDGVSLYPSAMARIEGYLMGAPKPITPETDLTKVDGYFARVRITRVGKHRSFPLVSIVKNGVRNFTNDLIGEELYLDKITLEDIKEFQDVDYEIIEGLYFDEGKNPKINSVIKSMFQLRKKYKDEGNGIQEVFKLLMNVAYGFTIQKESEYEITLHSNEDIDRYVARNFAFIHSSEKITGNKHMVKKYKAIDDHFSYPQCGVEVLSMSKRIMNEVMCLAEDCGFPIFYQDTDSMHIFQKYVKPLATVFSFVYGRELIGKQLGQFHEDFDLKGAEKDIHSVEGIFLGKKCYMDELIGYTEDGVKVEGQHLRMKGIPTNCIRNFERSVSVNVSSVKEIYLKHLKGEKINYDLLEGGFKIGFKKDKDWSNSSCTKFDRTLLFPGKEVQYFED